MHASTVSQEHQSVYRHQSFKRRRTKAAIGDLGQATGKEAVWLKLDLPSLKIVKAAAEEFIGCVYYPPLLKYIPPASEPEAGFQPRFDRFHACDQFAKTHHPLLSQIRIVQNQTQETISPIAR